MSVIFVFGSNLAGRHGAGAAHWAALHYDAANGVGEGRTGRAYAIPTKNADFTVRSLPEIKASVEKFLEHARIHKMDTFLITAIGCGYAGYSPEQIAPMFLGAPENCFISPRFNLGGNNATV